MARRSRNDGEAAEFLTCEEVAQRLRVHPETVRRLQRRGEFEGVAVRVARAWRWHRGRLEAWERNWEDRRRREAEGLAAAAQVGRASRRERGPVSPAEREAIRRVSRAAVARN